MHCKLLVYLPHCPAFFQLTQRQASLFLENSRYKGKKKQNKTWGKAQKVTALDYVLTAWRAKDFCAALAGTGVQRQNTVLEEGAGRFEWQIGSVVR